MPSLAKHESLEFVKALVLGTPGAGKTGGLTSLVAAGYDLYIYDFDNLLASLVQFVIKDCPDKIDKVHYQTFTDNMKGLTSPMEMIGSAMKVKPFLDGSPKAFGEAMHQLNNWEVKENGAVVEAFGKPAEFGPNAVVVIDSLTTLSAAAFRYVQGMNPAAKEPQSYYFAAQQLIIQVINLLCSKQFRTNVLVLSHITYDRDEKGNLMKGWPRSVGSALNDQIAGYFNCALMVERQGSRRSLVTNASGLVDLKNPVSFKIAERLPLETGLADFFKVAISK